MSRSSSGFSSGVVPSMSWDHARDMYARSQRNWSQTHEQLTSAILERTTSPLTPSDLRQKDAEISELRRQLAEIQADMAGYREQLQRAEATILQQQVTIRNQSKAIENPRPGKDFPTTPRHRPTSYGPHLLEQNRPAQISAFGPPEQQTQSEQGWRMPSLYGAVPPANASGPLQQQSRGSGMLFDPTIAEYAPQAPKAGTTKVNEYGSPKPYASTALNRPTTGNRPDSQISSLGFTPLMNSFDPFEAPQQPALPTRGLPTPFPSVQPAPSVASPESIVSNPYPETSIPSLTTVAAKVSPAVDEAKIISKFQQVFSMAQQYARNYANVPSTAGDNALPKELKEKLLEAATTTTAFGLMTDRSSRYLLVSKIILFWIIKNILRFNTFSGLCADIDQLVNGIKATIYQDTDSKVRYLLLVNMANEIKKLSDKPGFAAYVDHLSQQHAVNLQRVVRPMMHHHHLPMGEWNQDLLALVREAFNLARLMFSSPHEFNFSFHNYGSRFNVNEMINIDPNLGSLSAGQLRDAKATVRLATTPLVNMRQNKASGESREQVVVKAKVLLKKQHN